MKAVIRDFRRDPKNPVVAATVTLTEGDSMAIVESNSDGLRRFLVYEGIVGVDGKRYKPEDGAEFIRQLPYFFDSGYARAEVLSE